MEGRGRRERWETEANTGSRRPRWKAEADASGGRSRLMRAAGGRREQGAGTDNKRSTREKLEPARKETEIETGDAEIGSVWNRPKQEPRRQGEVWRIQRKLGQSWKLEVAGMELGPSYGGIGAEPGPKGGRLGALGRLGVLVVAGRGQGALVLEGCSCSRAAHAGAEARAWADKIGAGKEEAERNRKPSSRAGAERRNRATELLGTVVAESGGVGDG